MNILLAEDQAMIRTALASLLRLEAGFTVTEAADGNAAHTLLKQQSFDLLLSDIEMPGKSGIELVQAIQQVMAGKRVVDSELLLNSLGEQDPLSDKERQALRLASEGKSTSEIAAALYIAEGTARNYLSDAISKLSAANRIDAARIARQKGWL